MFQSILRFRLSSSANFKKIVIDKDKNVTHLLKNVLFLKACWNEFVCIQL